MEDMTTTTSTHRATTAPSHQSGEHRIVVGVDGSECATRALDFALHEAVLRGALLHIVGVYEIPPSAGWVCVSLEPFEASAAASVTDALTRVHELEPSVVTKGEHVHGFAGDVLVEASRGASLLILGSRGHGELTNLLIGSVSEHCAHHAACPVTIVR